MLATKKVYLRTLPDSTLATRYSVGALRRAAQVQRFLKELDLEQEGFDLLVLSPSDWHELSSFPYGLPFSKFQKDPNTHVQRATLFVAANYPPRLLQRFDASLLKAAKGGYKAPGEPRELLDLLAGCEWARARLRLQKEQPREEQDTMKWHEEIKAVSYFREALRRAGHDFLLEQFEAWLGVQKAGGEEAERSEFRYPRCKMPFAVMLYLQGELGLESVRQAVS
ncbi:MAG: hypothetical protein ACRCYY_10335 [Trueperaceae bacterium]